MFYTSSFKKNGFTFLELIIAILVFMTGVLGTFLLAQRFIFSTQVSVSRLTASFLAQEGIEIVRNLRDENWLNDRNWNSGLGAGDWQSGYNDPDLDFLQSNGRMYLDGNGLYSHDQIGVQTKFKRKITIESVDESFPPDGITDYLEVAVLISWQEKTKSYQLEVQENLYPWWSD